MIRYGLSDGIWIDFTMAVWQFFFFLTIFLRGEQFLKELIMQLPYNPAIILLGIYPKETLIFIHTKPCTQMFIAALFAAMGEWLHCDTPISMEHY